jgi:hypothetical protein
MDDSVMCADWVSAGNTQPSFGLLRSVFSAGGSLLLLVGQDQALA